MFCLFLGYLGGGGIYIHNNVVQIIVVRPRGYKAFLCSTQLSTKFQLLIKNKIPTNEEVSCLKSLRCCIYNANKC